MKGVESTYPVRAGAPLKLRQHGLNDMRHATHQGIKVDPLPLLRRIIQDKRRARRVLGGRPARSEGCPNLGRLLLRTKLETAPYQPQASLTAQDLANPWQPH